MYGAHRLRAPNINCIHFAQGSKCAHPDSRGTFSARECIFISDRRASACRIQIPYVQPSPPPRKP